jgi:hypothetical protein
MPGWYVHMEVANRALQELGSGHLSEPSAHFQAPWDAQALSEICYRWRNYYALGAIGPDLFYLLPDFKGQSGDFIRRAIGAVLDLWESVDPYISKYGSDIFGVRGGNNEDLINAITGGLYKDFSDTRAMIKSAIRHWVVGWLARSYDWFAVFGSGVPRGYADSGFYWSDMFHYRATSDFPRVMFSNGAERYDLLRQDFRVLDADPDMWGTASWTDAADRLLNAETEIAFALGWMTHCAVDTVGHSFTNAKCGGPYRDHWLRHHLCENHMDAFAYLRAHPDPAKRYGGLGTSALHFRIALRQGDVLFPGKQSYPDENDPNYQAGRYVHRFDLPMYDYTTGFPQNPINNHGLQMYPLGHTGTEAHLRAKFFDTDPPTIGPAPKPDTFPRHWSAAIREAMREVFPEQPQLLTHDRVFGQNLAGDGPGGMPTDAALWQMYELAFRYLRFISSSALESGPPAKPGQTVPYPLPTAPGYDQPDDAGRGDNPSDPQHDSTTPLQDILLAISEVEYTAQRLIHWLLTSTGLNTHIANNTAGWRRAGYSVFLEPAYRFKMAARRPLVEQGFLTPQPEEIDAGLCTLGLASTGRPNRLISDLNDPSGFTAAIAANPDLSGRDSNRAEGRDDRYPRDVIADELSYVTQQTGVPASLLDPVNLPYLRVGGKAPSEFLSPFTYPDRTPGGGFASREEEPALAGPYVTGVNAQALLDSAPRLSVRARDAIEKAASPDETRQALLDHLPHGRHLGAPLNYSLSLMARLTAGVAVPNFNLDADRGYAWKCWTWKRVDPDPTAVPPDVYELDLDGTATPGRFAVVRPSTPPQGWDPCGDAAHKDAYRTDAEVAQHAYHPGNRLVLTYLP